MSRFKRLEIPSCSNKDKRKCDTTQNEKELPVTKKQYLYNLDKLLEEKEQFNKTHSELKKIDKEYKEFISKRDKENTKLEKSEKEYQERRLKLETKFDEDYEFLNASLDLISPYLHSDECAKKLEGFIFQFMKGITLSKYSLSSKCKDEISCAANIICLKLTKNNKINKHLELIESYL